MSLVFKFIRSKLFIYFSISIAIYYVFKYEYEYIEMILDYLYSFDIITFLYNFFNRFFIYILLIPFFSVFTYIYYVYTYKNAFMNRLVRESETKAVEHLGQLHNFVLVGVIGTGKSAFLQYISTLLARDKLQRARKALDNISRKLLYANCNTSDIDNYIKMNYDHKKYYSIDDYVNFSLSICEHFDYDKDTDITVKFTINGHKLWFMIAYYVELYYITRLRGMNVLSNTAMMTNSQSTIILTEDLFLFSNKSTLPIEKYLVLLEDEKAITDNAKASSGQYGKENNFVQNNQDKQLNTILVRHYSAGTNTNISVAQSIEDITATQRRLYQTFVYIQSRSREDLLVFEKEIGYLNMLINKVENIYTNYENSRRARVQKLYSNKSIESYIPIPFVFSEKRLNKKAELIEKDIDDFVHSDNIYKRIIKYILEKIEKLEELLILKRQIEIHYSFSSLGKQVIDNEMIDAFAMNVYLLAKNIYSQYSTHNYEFLKEDLNRGCINSLAAARKWSGIQSTRDEMKYSGYKAFDRILNRADDNKNTEKRYENIEDKENDDDDFDF